MKDETKERLSTAGIILLAMFTGYVMGKGWL